MTFRAVIFDLDGTLLDTLADIAAAANAVLAELELPVHPLDKYRHFVGDGVRVLLERIIPPEKQTPDLLLRAAARFAEIYDTTWNATSRPYAGVRSLLAELAARGIPLAVLSNKPQRFTELCVGAHFGDLAFAAIFGQRPNVPRKPDPAGALEIASLLALPPAEIAYVGDTSVDMRTATSAGMQAIGVSWGFRSVQELREHGAERILHHPCDLLDV